MVRDYKQSPVLTVAEVAYFLGTGADAVGCRRELSMSSGYWIVPTGWLMLQIRREIAIVGRQVGY